MQFKLTKQNQLNGLFYHIYYVFQNYERSFVDITPSTSLWGDEYALVNYTETGDYNQDCFSTQNESYSYIILHFPNNKLRITHYGIKTRPDNPINFLKSWKFYGSTNENSYEELDSKTESDDLLGLNITKTYKTHKTGTYSYFKLEQSKANSDGNYYLVLNNIELFGTLCYSTDEFCPLPSENSISYKYNLRHFSILTSLFIL